MNGVAGMQTFRAGKGFQRNGMNLIMDSIGAHPGEGEEVAVMDDGDVGVYRRSVRDIASSKERMGKA